MLRRQMIKSLVSPVVAVLSSSKPTLGMAVDVVCSSRPELVLVVLEANVDKSKLVAWLRRSVGTRLAKHQCALIPYVQLGKYKVQNEKREYRWCMLKVRNGYINRSRQRLA